MNRAKYIFVELAHHLPYSIFGVVAAMIMMGLLTFMAQIAGAEAQLAPSSQQLFHIFHPSHVLFSAVATTAMFWKHDEHKLLKAVVIGFAGSVGVCGVSDIIIPFVGGKLLGYPMHWHLCLINEPMLVYPFAALGVVAGLMVTKTFERSTEYSHAVHVFLSSAASILFLIGFGWTGWMEAVAAVFFITVFAVMMPCCLSDIVFPMLCTHRYCRHPHEKSSEG